MKCCVCGREGNAQQTTAFTITDEEKAVIKGMGVEPQDSYVYCHPCLAILQDKEAGARLIQGVARKNLTAMGHPSPGQASSKVYERLVEGRRTR